jgi:hypothetical protein
MGSGLQLSSSAAPTLTEHPGKLPSLKIMAHRSSSPAKKGKTQITVNPLFYSLCGEYSCSIADELEHIC